LSHGRDGACPHDPRHSVVDSGTVRGIASVQQVHEVPPEQRMQRRVSELMRPLTDDLVVGPDDSIFDALGKATRNQVGWLVVLKDSRLVGYLSLKDITHVLASGVCLMAPGPRTAVASARGPGGPFTRK
jgi:predicted transcriptional regulator